MWKDEFVELLFSRDPSKINAKKAIDLKYENTPSFLYKYKDFDNDGYSLELLESDKMYLARPTEFNDPFDSIVKLASKDLLEEHIKEFIVPDVFNDMKQNFGASDKELGKLNRSKNVGHDLAKFVVKKRGSNLSLEERARYIEQEEKSFTGEYLNLNFKENLNVACFSETYKSILMWSHYTNNHEGFCIAYNFKELGLNNPVVRFIFPVIYDNAIFDIKDYLPRSNKDFGNVIKTYIDNIKLEDISEGIALPEENKTMNNMFIFYMSLIKSKEWDYEEEWRYILPKKIKNEKIYLNVPKPKSIYLGAKISKENCEELLRIGKERNINVYKMEMKPSEFALESNIIHKCKN